MNIWAIDWYEFDQRNSRVFCLISSKWVAFGAYYVKVVTPKHSASEM